MTVATPPGIRGSVSGVNAALEQLWATSKLEMVAASLALAYLLLAVRRSLLGWPCAFASSLLYLVVMAESRLAMQAALQVFYALMAVYGFWTWRKTKKEEGEIVPLRWSLGKHVAAVVVVLAGTLVNGALLGVGADAGGDASLARAMLPYVDAFVTWGSVLSTFMAARRLVENWLYWLVVDLVAAGLYFRQGLVVTALLFLVYVGIVVRGYLVWRRTIGGPEGRPVSEGAIDG